jgi:hypothetical protein
MAAYRNTLVMVRESHTQNMSLIRQGQRGTQIFLARNSGVAMIPIELLQAPQGLGQGGKEAG